SATNERHRLQVEARIASNNQVALQQICEHGLGIARLMHAEAQPALERGGLVRVMPEYRCESLPVWAVTPNLAESEAAKVRSAIAHLKRHFALLPASNLLPVATRDDAEQ
ncbi:MAG TPA: LysR substrate-binding domain-containing protein, partial [Polyangiaceae bacterium]|nr:LysR substrate-binding domain-containing protein [Polyangiaceae bacterium]